MKLWLFQKGFESIVLAYKSGENDNNLWTVSGMSFKKDHIAALYFILPDIVHGSGSAFLPYNTHLAFLL